nr:MAG TPA: hypothetical protein [Caudoviricetes sp.]
MKTYSVKEFEKEIFLMTILDENQFQFNTLEEYQEEIPTPDFISALIVQRDIMMIPEITKIQEKAEAIKVDFPTRDCGYIALSFPFGQVINSYRIGRYRTIMFSKNGSMVTIKDGVILSPLEAAVMILAVGLNAFPETPDSFMGEFLETIRLPQYKEEKKDLKCQSTVTLDELEIVRKEFVTGDLWKSLKSKEEE